MKPATIFLGFVIIIGGLWWWFGGNPRNGPTEGIFVERYDQLADPQIVQNFTNDVKIFGFKLTNATSTDITATSSIFILEPYSTFSYREIKNIRLSYNNNVIARLPSMENPSASLYFNPIILSKNTSGQFWLTADLIGYSTASATTTLGIRLVHIDAGSGGLAPIDLPVYRRLNNLTLDTTNYEPSVKWFIIPPTGR